MKFWQKNHTEPMLVALSFQERLNMQKVWFIEQNAVAATISLAHITFETLAFSIETICVIASFLEDLFHSFEPTSSWMASREIERLRISIFMACRGHLDFHFLWFLKVENSIYRLAGLSDLGCIALSADEGSMQTIPPSPAIMPLAMLPSPTALQPNSLCCQGR